MYTYPASTIFRVIHVLKIIAWLEDMSCAAFSIFFVSGRVVPNCLLGTNVTLQSRLSTHMLIISV